MKLIETVPNFSEGRDFQKIDTIVHALKGDRVSLLHTDIGAAANRTVVTAAGVKGSLLESVFESTKVAISLIDLRKQTGVHPFIGAVDVIPFVPLGSSTIDDCVECAKILGESIGNDLNVPVFLYGKAASHEFRSHLSNLRRGNFARLGERMANNSLMVPDFGPDKPHPTAGAVAVGARPILVAFNVSIKSSDLSIAQNIAQRIRTHSNNKDSSDSAAHRYRLPELKAIGWHVAEYNCTQVSMNLTDYSVTPPHVVYDVIKEIAALYDTEVLGSELVGLIPKKALIEAGRHYSTDSNGLTDSDLIEAAVEGLGLNCHYPFDPSQKIIEERLAQTGLIDTTRS